MIKDVIEVYHSTTISQLAGNYLTKTMSLCYADISK